MDKLGEMLALLLDIGIRIFLFIILIIISGILCLIEVPLGVVVFAVGTTILVVSFVWKVLFE